MTNAMARQESHRRALEHADHHGCTGFPEWCVQVKLLYILETGHVVQTRSSDDSNVRFGWDIRQHGYLPFPGLGVFWGSFDMSLTSCIILILIDDHYIVNGYRERYLSKSEQVF